MTAPVASQLLAAAAWAAKEPGYEPTAPLLRFLARATEAGSLDLSRLPPPVPDEGAWGGLLARLRRIGIDVVEMCPRTEVGA